MDAVVRRLVPYAGVVLVATLSAVWVLRLWTGNLSIPLTYAAGADGYAQMAIAKNLFEHGSFYVFPQLAAPLGAANYDYPMTSTLHLAMEWILAELTRNPFVALNLLFLLSFPLAALTAFYAMRRMQVPAAIAFAPAVIFALLPSHFYRGEEHLFYATYWVLPLAALACVTIARGEPPPDLRLLVAAAVLIAADNQYYAAFTIAFVLLAAALGALRARSVRPVLFAGGFTAVVVVVFTLQLVPTLLYHHAHGTNGTAYARYPQESQMYGLQITQLLLPIGGHRFPPFAGVRADFDDRTVLGNGEGAFSTLGAAGALGFLLLLGVLVVRIAKRVPPDLESLALLNLWGVMIATIGGFGTLFNYLVAPDIRAYARIAPFIGFFSLAGLALIVALCVRGRNLRVARSVQVLVVLAVVVAATWDQTNDGMIPSYASNERLYRNDATFLSAVQTELGPDSAIFELPWVAFPESPVVGTLIPEQLYRPYLHARSLRFSYGAITGRDPAEWQQSVGTGPVSGLVGSAAIAGFDGIMIFRDGYPDGDDAIERTLRRALPGALVSPDGKLAFYSTRELRKRLDAADPRITQPGYVRKLVSGVHLTYGKGFSIEESGGGNVWHWSDSSSSISLRNDDPEPRALHLSAYIDLGVPPGSVRVTLPGRTIDLRVAPSAKLDLDLVLPPGLTPIRFSTASPPLLSPADPRRLVFRLLDVRLLSGGQEKPSPAVASLLRRTLAVRFPADVFDMGRIEFTAGCSDLELDDADRWNWCGSTGRLRIEPDASGRIRFRATVTTPGQPSSDLRVSAAGKSRVYAIRPQGTDVALDLDASPGRPAVISFSSDAARLQSRGDARTLVVRLGKPALEVP
jgi:phosphoglycerol transferase